MHIQLKLAFQSFNIESSTSRTGFRSTTLDNDCVPALCAASSHISNELISAGRRFSRNVSADLNRARPGRDRQYLLRSGIPLTSTARGEFWLWYNELSMQYTGICFGRKCSEYFACRLFLTSLFRARMRSSSILEKLSMCGRSLARVGAHFILASSIARNASVNGPARLLSLSICF